MIVSGARKVAKVAGKAFDAEDRKVIGQGFALLGAAAFFLIGGAAAVGIALRVFELVTGM